MSAPGFRGCVFWFFCCRLVCLMSDGRHQTATASHQFARGHCRALAATLEAARGLPDLLS
jgi:hypothetical protein